MCLLLSAPHINFMLTRWQMFFNALSSERLSLTAEALYRYSSISSFMFYQKILQQVAGKLKLSWPCALQWLLLTYSNSILPQKSSYEQVKIKLPSSQITPKPEYIQGTIYVLTYVRLEAGRTARRKHTKVIILQKAFSNRASMCRCMADWAEKLKGKCARFSL